MDTSTEATFVEDAYIEQAGRPRTAESHRSVAADEVGEDAPLLSEDGSDYSGRDSLDSRKQGTEPAWAGVAEFEGLPWWKRPSIYWLLPPFLLFTLAFGAIIVPKLNLIMDLVCEEYYASQSPDPIGGPGQQPDRCQTDAISSRSSLFLLYGGLCSGLLSAFTSPKLGALSDRYGRTRVLSFTTIGVLVSEVLTILAAKYPETVSVNWILVGFAIDGLSGSFIVGMALAFAYATDCTPPVKRNVAFGYFHACLFTGIAAGPVVAGYIINARAKYVGKSEAVLVVFYFALAAHAFFILFLAFVVPQSQSLATLEAACQRHREEQEKRDPATDWIQRLRGINLTAPLKILWPTGPGTSPALRWNLALLAATDTITFGVAMGAMGVIVIYTRRQFDWQELESGRFVSIINTSRVLSLVVVLPLMTRLVRGMKGAGRQRNTGSDRFDLSVIRVSMLFDMIGFLGYSFARDGNLFITSGALAAIGGMGSPTLGSALTKHVPADRVGELLGATGLLHAMARVVGPTIFNGIYSATVGSFRQTVFVCLTVTFALAFLCSWFVRPNVYLDDLVPEAELFEDGQSDNVEIGGH